MNKLALKLIDKYQNNTKNCAKKCRYTPSCSQYAKGCYEKFCFIKASFYVLFRLLKCNPLFKGGFDPIPLTKLEKKEKLKKLPNSIKNNKLNPFNYIIYYLD